MLSKLSQKETVGYRMIVYGKETLYEKIALRQ